MLAATYTSTLTTTATTSVTIETQTFKEATITTDWISKDSVVVGITVGCVLLLLLITLMVTSCHFILKNYPVKKGVPAVISSS
jgi:DMSO/TMAO reductase YedYZ heme-binding membrane subunit